ncbi:PKD domain-containing protein [Pseudoflavitalea sp. X16]|uniref:Ig-like domain-containing protein n=1 Tax=Paraflavitalea devenefica TaxID=2716334 RepID=UPI00141EBB04|nr:PKD domain-containing protein [Paraflavitalea devenefica]NII25928.1 PKD domain-containing protein [Paraflavitalea devenefica]
MRSKKPVLLIFYSTISLLLGSFVSVRAQAPTVTSFSPLTVCQGQSVTITGSNFINVTNVKLGSSNAANFTVNSPTSITATVADAAANGTVTVTNPDGTGTDNVTLTVLPSPKPALTDVGTRDAPFTNCDGNAIYQLIVSNNSVTTGTGNAYQIDWGDNTPFFTQTDWPAGSQTTHTYTNQGYYNIVLTITPPNNCKRSVTYRFYNGQNPLASFTTTTSTTGLCVPASIEFQIGNWYNNSAGTTYQVNFGDGSPNVTLSHPLNGSNTIQLLSHPYTTSSCPNPDFTATLKASNGCFTTTYTLNQIIIRKKPIADFTTPTTPLCINTSVCFTNQTTNGYSGNSCNTATTFLWDFGDGTTSTAANPPCHAYASPGVYTVTLTASNTACGNDLKTKQITVLTTSQPPVVAATPVVYCQGQPAVPLTATGTGLLWYSTATGGTGSATPPTPSTNTPGTTIYYVSQTEPNHCVSPRVPVTVTVNARPGAPVVTTPVQLCQNQAAAPLTATGTGLLWYTSATGGTGSSTAPTPSTAVIGNTTYYVSQTSNGCEGPRAAIVVTVNSLAGAPVVTSPITYCQNQPAVPLTAAGTGLLWYTSATGGTGSPTAPTPSTSAAGTTVYYVSQTTGCGESPRASITVTVNPGPSASISYTPATLCNTVSTPTAPNPPVTVSHTGTPGGTYSTSPSSGLPINATTGEINPSGATAGTYTIRYTIAGTGGCATYTATTTVTVNSSPTATITYPAICTSDGATPVNLTGTSGGVFTSTAGLTINPTTGMITPSTSTPGTYTVTYTIPPAAPCPGFVATTTVTITLAPVATIVYTPATLCNVVNTATTPNPPVVVQHTGTPGGSYSVSPSTGLSINTATGEINPSGATAGTYTIRYAIAGTGGCATYTTTTTVTVNSSPTATITYPAICTSDGATPVNLTGTSGGVFTSTTGLTIAPATGMITPSTSTPGTYTVTYTVPPAAPCPGFVTTTTVTITLAPVATIAYTPATLCNVVNTANTPNPPVVVQHTGTPGGGYSISPSTGLPINAATGEINPSGATAGTYTIKYTIAGTGGCSMYTATTVVTVNSAPTATIHYQSSPYCGGTNVPQQVSLSGTLGGVFSSSQGLSINSATGAINPALSIPGTYTVTYTIAASPPCPGYVATASVQVNESPVLSFPVATRTICSGGTAAFVPSSTVVNSTYTWSVTGQIPATVSGISSGTASGPNPVISLSFTNTGSISESLTIQVIPVNPTQNPCPGAPYALTLIVNPVPPAPVTDTANFCLGTPPAALQVNPLPGTAIKWYDENMVLLSNAPVINTAAPARFRYFVTQTNSYGCESPAAPIVAFVHPTPKIVSSSYTNPTTCGVPSGSIVLDVLDLNNNAMPGVPVLVHYDKFQTAYTVAASTDASGKITVPLTAGTYSGIYVETRNGCTSQKIPDIFVLRDPSPPAQPVAGYNPPICSEQLLTLTALTPTSTQAGPIDYVWVGPAFGPFADTTRNTVVSFPSAAMSYAGTYVVYAIQNNCISLPTSFEVTIKQSPSKPVIATRTPLCVGDHLLLQAYSSMPGNATLNYSWNGPGPRFPVNTPSVTIDHVKIEDAGIYSITVSSPQTGCSSTTDTLIQVGDYPIVQFAQDTLTLPTGYRLNLAPVITNAAQPGILPMKNYTWTPSQDIDCNDAACSSPVATIKNNVCYTVKATNVYGCSGSDVICVKVFCQNSQVFVPNAFVPLGNVPENRILMVRASGIASVKSFRVFNRWGKVVFERTNFAPNIPGMGWDGRVNGKMADTGVYIYTVDVICENGVPYTYKGNVTLL